MWPTEPGDWWLEMKELLEALGPWPTVQGIAIGIIVAGVGIWAMRRGMLDKSKDLPLEDVKAKWELYTQIRHIHENSFAMVEQLKRSNDLAEQQLAAVNRANDMRWNKNQ
jgi:hypothetical protein